MFKIGEFSKLTRVSARMLRYYDNCGLLNPAEIDSFTGYRMYSAVQIPLLTRIVLLRDMGFGVEEMKTVLEHFDDPEKMRQILLKKSEEIDATINLEQTKLTKIAALCSLLNKERITHMIYEVELKELSAATVLSLRKTIPDYNEEQQLWHELGVFLTKHNLACDQGGYSIYHDNSEKENGVDVEVAVPVKTMGESVGEFIYRELAAIPLAATIRFSGPYEGYRSAMEKLATWIENNGYQMAGLVRGLAVASPQDVTSPDDFLTEIQVPVQKI